MANRSARARHLTVVPDAPAASPAPQRVASTMVRFQLDLDVRDSESRPSSERTWRRVRVRSDLLLPELADVITSAIGWTASTDYVFSQVGVGSDHRYLPVRPRGGHDDDAVSAGDHVRIDSLLQTIGDELLYERDPGCGLTVRLISFDSDVDDLRPTCIDGVGNAYAGEQTDDATDSPVAAANARLAAASTPRSTEVESSAASQPIARLFRHTESAPVPLLLELLPRCELTIESSVDLPVAQVAMSKILWILECIGDGGILLAEGGTLPPAVVDAIGGELDWGIGWHGAGSKEIDHHQARDLREAVRDLGLARVWRGRLVRTEVGTRVSNDPIALWNYCAERLPLGRREYELDAGTLFLVALAASASVVQRDAMLVETMHSLRWGNNVLDAVQIHKVAHPTVAFLDLVGAHGPLHYSSAAGERSPSWSRRFARDALRT